MASLTCVVLDDELIGVVSVGKVRVLCERGANLNGTEGWGHSHLWCVQCAIPRDETGKQRAIEQILLAHGAEVIEEPPKLPWP